MRSGKRTHLAVAYARFSTEHQSSLEDQQSRNQSLAKKHGLRIVASFGDAAISRSRSDRPGLLQLYKYLEEHPEVGNIVVNELARLTGGLQQRVRLDEFCRARSIWLVHGEGEVDPTNEDHVEAADRDALEAQAEVRKGRKRTRNTLHTKAADGVDMARPPFGTRMAPIHGLDGQPLPRGMRLVGPNGKKVSSGVLEIDPDELPWLIKMFEWVAHDQLSVDGVARRLTEAGVPPKNSKTSGKTNWARTSVVGILRNPRYKGVRIYGATETKRFNSKAVLVPRSPGDDGYLETESPLGALIDPVLWQQANDVLDSRAGNNVHSKRRTNPPRAFDHLVFCGRCGHKMYGANQAKPRKDGSRPDAWRYTCTGRRPGHEQIDGFGPPCQRNNSVSEKALIAALDELVVDGPQHRVTVRYAAPVDQALRLQTAQRDIERLVETWKRTREMGRRGLYDPDELQILKGEHDKLVAEAEVRLSAAKVQPTGSVTFDLTAREALGEMCRLLRERRLAGPVLGEGLREMGLVRVLIDAPHVQLQWSS